MRGLALAVFSLLALIAARPQFIVRTLPPPVLTSLSVTSGTIGTTVILTGRGFQSTQGSGSVVFLFLTATPTAWSDTSITVTVPVGAVTGDVHVNTVNGPSNRIAFTVTGGGGAYYTGTLFSAATTGLTCSTASVQSAINSAASGDIVRLPAACTIATAGSVDIPNTKGILLDGNGATVNWHLTIEPNATTSTRLTGLTNTRNGDNTTGNTALTISSNSVMSGACSNTAARWRVDHSTFHGSGADVIDLYQCNGVFDHNTVDGGTALSDETIHWFGWGAGDQTGWVNPMPISIGSRALGTTEAIIFEDNTLSAASLSQGNPPFSEMFYGARVIFRYNTLNYFRLDAHGNNQNIGARWWESYLNVFHNMQTGNYLQVLNLRAGSGVIFGNTETGDWPTPPPIQMCQEQTGVNANYRSDDQIGAGTCGANPCTWGSASNSVSDPVYAWSNAQAVNLNECGGQPPYIPVMNFNRDVYTNVDSASCTAGGACTGGVGIGTVLPTTCTAATTGVGTTLSGVGFWKTDEGGNWDTTHGGANDGTLYKCTAVNTWTRYWTPTTYPDPLQTGLDPNK